MKRHFQFVCCMAAILCAVATVFSQTPGTKKWHFTMGEAVRSCPAIGSDGTIYVQSYDDNLYAINPDGTQKWIFDTGETSRYDGEDVSPVIGIDGTIYTIARGTNLFALSPDGAQKWAFAGGMESESPAVGADGTVYVVAVTQLSSSLYAINPDGTQNWTFTVGYSSSVSSPTLASDGTIYVVAERSLYAVNWDGTEKWVFPSAGRYLSGARSGLAIDADGTIYVGAYETFYAINPNGTQKWTFATKEAYGLPAIGEDGTIYVASDDEGKLYAINPDGTQKWVISLGCCIYTIPTVGVDGTIYVGSNGGDLYAINPNGTQRWIFRTLIGTGVPDNIHSPAALGPDGIVYFGTSVGHNRLYAIYSSSMGLASSPWPKYQGGYHNLGRREGAPQPNDVGITSIQVSNIIGLGSSISIGARVWNFGTEAKSNFPISYQINADTPVTENFSEILQPNAAATKTFTTAWVPTALGTHTITVRTGLVGDQMPMNDLRIKTVQVIAANDIGISKITLPKPAGLGVPTTIQAVVKNLGANNQSNFSASYQVNSETPVTENFSHAVQPNDSVVIAFATPWVPQALGIQKITVRTGLAGDQKSDNDAVIDSVQVVFANDVGISGFVVPNQIGRGVPTPIKVRVTNFGANPQSSVAVSYQINTETPVTENFSGTLEPLQTATMTFSSPWSQSVPGTYQITARTNLNGDQDAGNDAAQKTVQVVNAVYFGTWRGTTNQSLPISFTVNGADMVENLEVDLRITFGVFPNQFSCVYKFSSTGQAPIQNNAFEIPVSTSSGVSYSTSVRGAFTSPTACGGTAVAFTASGGICNGQLIIGSIGVSEKSWSATGTPVAVKEPASSELPASFRLSQNYPNPFNPGTIIEYTLAKSSYVELKIYDILGNEVQTLVNGKQPAGRHRVQFDSRGLVGGVYLYRLQAGDKVETKKMIIVR